MAEIERLTISVPSDMAAIIRSAGAGGDYASSSEVVREALREWEAKRAAQASDLAALRADIEGGLADLSEGRVRDFDVARIVDRGRKLLSARSRSG